MAAARSLCLVFHYAIKYCVISGVLILFKSLQLPADVFDGVSIHISLIEMSAGT